jgi:hypothetical protein
MDYWSLRSRSRSAWKWTCYSARSTSVRRRGSTVWRCAEASKVAAKEDIRDRASCARDSWGQVWVQTVVRSEVRWLRPPAPPRGRAGQARPHAGEEATGQAHSGSGRHVS